MIEISNLRLVKGEEWTKVVVDIKSDVERIDNEEIEEVILALPATVEGDTTNFFIYKNISGKVPKVTTIARGVGIGEELEYIDEVTLGRSLLARTDFNQIYQKRK